MCLSNPEAKFAIIHNYYVSNRIRNIGNASIPIQLKLRPFKAQQCKANDNIYIKI